MNAPEATRPPARPRTPRATQRSVLWYVLARVIGAVLIVLLALTLVFVAIEVLPGNPLMPLPRGGSCGTLPGGGTNCDLRLRLIAEWGLDKPLWDRYVIFLSNVLSGNLGVSTNYRWGVPVWSLITPTVPLTLAMIAVVLLLVAILSLPIGLRMRRRTGGVFDLTASLWLAFPVAFSTLFLGFAAFYLLGFVFRVAPLQPTPAADGGIPLPSLLAYSVLPVLVLVAGFLGLFVWLVRDHPLRPEGESVLRIPGDGHASTKSFGRRVAQAIPCYLGALPALLPWVIGGEFLMEVLFNLKGLGLLLWSAVVRLDFFLTMGIVVVTALLLALPIMLVADVLQDLLTRRWERPDSAQVKAMRATPRATWLGFRRMLEGGLGAAGIALVGTMVVVSLVGPMLVGPYPTMYTISRPFLPPSADHPLGTDGFGRDLLTLVVYGGQGALGVAVMAFETALFAGLYLVGLVGLLGERARPWLLIPVDALLVLSLPFALLLGMVGVPGGIIWGPLVVATPIAARILLLETTGTARVSPGPGRSRLSLEERGGRAMRLLWENVPRIVGNAFLAVSLAILVWAILGFVGFGLNVPGAPIGWGQIENGASNELAVLTGRWWYFVPPIYCIFLAALGPLLLALGFKDIGRRMGEASAPSPADDARAMPSVPVEARGD